MTDVTAGQTVTLISQWYDYEGGPAADLDATPTITLTNVATSAVVIATTTGVTHPGTGTYGYPWATTTALAPGTYLAQWNGTKAGAPVAASELVTLTAGLTSRSYATTTQLAAYLHTDAPANAAKLLEDATRALDDALLTAVYDVDAGGMPTSPAVQAAFAEAVCGIVEWWGETGDPVGADGGWDSVSAGPVSLSGRSGSAAATPIAGGSLPPRGLAALRRVPSSDLLFGVWSAW